MSASQIRACCRRYTGTADAIFSIASLTNFAGTDRPIAACKVQVWRCQRNPEVTGCESRIVGP
eukprot:scaffold56747_cov35-Tisochrysis_lutea.AAC.3